ncbi:hypothetical protein ACXWQD_10015, partial [Streptococcus pyogenes]
IREYSSYYLGKLTSTEVPLIFKAVILITSRKKTLKCLEGREQFSVFYTTTLLSFNNLLEVVSP